VQLGTAGLPSAPPLGHTKHQSPVKHNSSPPPGTGTSHRKGATDQALWYATPTQPGFHVHAQHTAKCLATSWCSLRYATC
jgi:hypothetical protein